LCAPVLWHMALAPDLRAAAAHRAAGQHRTGATMSTRPATAKGARTAVRSTQAPPMGSATALSPRQGLAYGLLGLPLAFVALPLYVLLPNHYARAFAAPLAALGFVLLAARGIDAVLDPLIGRWCDRLAARSHATLLAVAAASAVVLALGLWGLLFPPAAVVAAGAAPLLTWAGVVMAITYTAYSVVS